MIRKVFSTQCGCKKLIKQNLSKATGEKYDGDRNKVEVLPLTLFTGQFVSAQEIDKTFIRDSWPTERESIDGVVKTINFMRKS
jgi:hypothetical protein